MCGAAFDRRAADERSVPGEKAATEWIDVTSRASWSVRSGSTDGSRLASIVLPPPGYPEEGEVVPAGRGDLHGQAPRGLPGHVDQVGLGRRRGPSCGRGRRIDLPAQEVDHAA